MTFNAIFNSDTAKILDALAHVGESSETQLASKCELSREAISKKLAFLVEKDLVRVHKRVDPLTKEKIMMYYIPKTPVGRTMIKIGRMQDPYNWGQK